MTGPPGFPTGASAIRFGLDRGGTAHAVCAVGREALRFTVAHTAGSLAELRRRPARLAAPADLPIAIERPSGLLVDTLVEAAMEAGVAPIITRQSGKSPSVVLRWACNKRLRAAPTCFAGNSRHASA